MRKPFIFFLLLISAFCWFSDLIELVFYFLKIETANKHVYSKTGSAIVLLTGLLIAAVVLNKKYALKNRLKDITARKQEWLLFLMVSLPVILLGLFRSIFPDQNFDTYHFELYLQEYDFNENKINFAPAAIRTYYFPLPERIFALFRHVLGYRLGTIFNTFLLVTILASAYDFIKKYLALYQIDRKPKLIVLALLSLFALLADNTLFIIGSYKPDLIGIPLLLELLYIAFLGETGVKKTARYAWFFLLASLAITYKLTYLPYVGLLALIFFFRNFNTYPVFHRFAIPLLVLFFPSIYMAYNFAETGNPIFPFFNSIFQAPLYPVENFRDNRWGHKKAYEFFIYPVVTLLDKKRTNEWELYSYRLLFGYIISLGTITYYLLKGRKNKTNSFLQQLFFLSVLAVIFDYACLITTGYYRYGIIVETLYGLIIGLWLVYLQKKWITLVLLFLIVFQSFDTYKNIFIKNINLSWHNYDDVLHNKQNRNNNIRYLLNDYGRVIDKKNILPKIDAFVSIEPFPYDGLAKLLSKETKIYDILFYGRTADSIREIEKNVIRPQSQTKNLMVACNIESMDGGTIEMLNKKGYLVSDMYEVYPDFLKFDEPVFLLKIKYLDTGKFTIKTLKQYSREEEGKPKKNDFAYQSANKMKVFIREAPYTYNWYFLPEKYDLTINQQKYATTNRFGRDKIISVETNDLTLHCPNEIPFIIIVQEIEVKK